MRPRCLERGRSALGRGAVGEEPVDGRAGAAHVGPKRAAAIERRRRAARRRGRSAAAPARSVAAAAPRRSRACARAARRSRGTPLVEARVDGAGRLLLRAVREQEQHGVVRGQVRAARGSSRRRCRAAGPARGRTGRRRRALRASACSSLGRQRLGERVVGEPKRRRGVGAAAAEAGGDRDPLLDPGAPAGLDACRRRERSSAARTSVSSAKPSTVSSPAGSSAIVSQRSTRWSTVAHLVQAVAARRADDEREVDLRGRVGAVTRGRRRGRRTPGVSASARAERSRPIAASAAAASAAGAASCERERVRERLAAVGEGALDDRLTAGRPPARCVETRRAPRRRSAAGGTPRARRDGSRCARVASCTSTDTAP